MCTKMRIINSLLPNVCIPCVEVEQKEANIALEISFMLLTEAISVYGGQKYYQKMWDFMLDLFMLITHFHQNLIDLQSKFVLGTFKGGSKGQG